MIAKSLIAAAAIATTLGLALPASQAEAKTNFDISISFGAGGFYPGYYPVYYNQPNHISCKKGRAIVDHSGFHNVNTVDCSLPGYKYTAWKKGHKFLVKVNGNGHITNVSKIF